MSLNLLAGKIMKQEKPKCPTCGHSITSGRWEKLSTGLVHNLVLAIQAVHRNGKNRFHYVNDLHLGHTAAANFQKLRYHALIAHADSENPKSGEWLITKRGGQFLRGEITVPKAVLIFDNTIQEHGDQLVHIKEFRNLPPEFDMKFAYEEPVLADNAFRQQGLFLPPKRS